LILNDIACNSIHSSFYVEDPSITGSAIKPRTFIRGGEQTSGYVIVGSGIDDICGGNTKTPATLTRITQGIKLLHNIGFTPPTATLNLYKGDTTGKVGMKFDLSSGNIMAAQDKVCIIYDSGILGVGGITAGELSDTAYSGLNRALHVSGNVMVGAHPSANPINTASSAMIMLNKATTVPSSKTYPGLYHRRVADTPTQTTLGGTTNSIANPSGGLGITSPDFITFQTGVGATQSNSVVINSAGDVSVTGRANLNGPVTVGKNFEAVTPHFGISPNMDISGILYVSSTTLSYASEPPRIKLVSYSISQGSDLPGLGTDSANEIRGVQQPNANSGFLRLSAQSSTNSCIDLIGVNTNQNASQYSNSVRISTAGVDRMLVNGSGNVGIGTVVPGVRLDVVGTARVNSGAATGTALTTTGRIGVNQATPGVDLDVVGAARVNSGSASGTALTTTGWVGVNKATPTVALDVAGAAKITGNLDMTSYRINNLLDPSSTQDAATKSYVDSAASAATTAASNAQTKANSATADAAAAQSTANSAVTAAAAAQSTANSAVTAAATAQTKANAVATGTTQGSATAGAQYLYPAQDSAAGILTNGAWRMYVAATGNIGIGTTTPAYPIHVDVTTVAASSSSATSTAGYWWGSGSSSIGGSNIASGTAAQIAMKLNGSVWIDRNLQYVGFWQTSDRRIKKNINYNISSECLNIFRKLKCSNYSFVDEREHKTNVYGYIAQDVSTVLPYAVTTQTGFIPSLYSLAKISRENGIIKITCSEQKPYIFHSLHDKDGTAFVTDKNEPASDKDGGRHFKVKLFDVSMNEFIVKITQIVDNGVFTIDNDEISVKLTDTEYFVFGQEVDDYKILNNEAITVVATAVLQEVDRQQQADKVRIAELEATVARQQSLINDILERLKKVGA